MSDWKADSKMIDDDIERYDDSQDDPASQPEGEADVAMQAAKEIMESVQDLSEADYQRELAGVASIIRAAYAPVQARADMADELATLAQSLIGLIEGEIITGDKYPSGHIPNPRDMAYAQAFFSYSSHAINLRGALARYNALKGQ